MDTDPLRVAALTRRFRKIVANDGVSLSVRPGAVVGLLGHNGAGKTTLVSQVMGLLKPNSGDIQVAGIDAVRRPGAARRHVAVQPQAQAPMDGLTPRTAIEISGRIRGLSARDARAAAGNVADELDIGPWLDQRALPEGRGLSGGIRRLTGFAMAIAAPTPLLILDEPTNDVDASRRRLLWDAVRRRGDLGIGILLVTHNVAEAERIVDELVILDRGQVVAEGSPAQLRGSHHSDLRLELQLPPGGTDPSAHVPGLGITRRIQLGRRCLLTVTEQAVPQAVAWASAQQTCGRIEGFSLTPATLEDAYVALTAPADPGSNPGAEPGTGLRGEEMANV